MRFVSFVISRRGVSEGLCQFRHVQYGRRVIEPDQIRSFEIRRTQFRIVPPSHDVKINARAAAGTMTETFQDSGDVAFGHLKRVGNRDTESVIPDREQHRRLQHANGIDRFPEKTFSTTGISDRAKYNFIAVGCEETGTFA